MDKIRHFSGLIPQKHGADHVRGNDIPGADQEIASSGLSVKPGSALRSIDSVKEGEAGRKDSQESGNHKIEVPFLIRTVAFLPGVHVNGSFYILYPQADHGLDMSLEHRKIHNKVGVQKVGVEVEVYAVAQIPLFKGSFMDIYVLYPIALLEQRVAEVFKGVGRGIRILWIKGDHPLPDGNLVDSMFLEQNHHVLHHAAGGDDPPLGKADRLRPENDVRLDEHSRISWKVIETAAKLNRFSDGILLPLIADN